MSNLQMEIADWQSNWEQRATSKYGKLRRRERELLAALAERGLDDVMPVPRRFHFTPVVLVMAPLGFLAGGVTGNGAVGFGVFFFGTILMTVAWHAWDDAHPVQRGD